MNKINEKVFKEYDLRGVADIDLPDDVVYSIGLAVGTYLKRNGENEVILCQDVRKSSPRIASMLTNALVKTGQNVTDIGVAPTPVCYFAGRFLNKSASVMVTASHNPAEYNGMKITSGDSTIFGNEIKKIYKIAADGDFEHGNGALTCYNNIEQEFVDYISGKITLKRPLKIAIDAGNGTAGTAATKLYRKLGCQVTELFCDPDPSFPNHHPDPTIPKNLEALTKCVMDNGLDVGLAFDGDGDRLGVIDNEGRIIWGDTLQILFWRNLLPKFKNAEVIVEVKCSQALVDEVLRLGGRPFFYKTGHSLIKAKMREKGLVFAGEMSGHMFFADEYFGYDDALYAGARLLRLLSEKPLKLSDLLTDIPKYFATPEIRIDIPEEKKEVLMGRIKKHFAASLYDVIDVDGVRVSFPGGWGLLRMSNTQPIIVMRAEANTEAGLDLICNTLKSVLDNCY